MTEKKTKKMATAPPKPLGEIAIELSKLDASAVQPASRHAEPAVRALCQAVSEVGMFSRIVVKKVSRQAKYTVIDGHRRLACARQLGWTTVNCVVYEGPLTAAELWALVNGTLRPLKGVDWFFGWAVSVNDPDGDPETFLKRMYATTAGHIKRMIKLFGLRRAVTIGLETKHSPTVASFANGVFSHASGRLQEKCTMTEREIGEWMLVFGAEVRKFIGHKPTKRALLKFQNRVKKMQAFPKGSWD